jgi:hypothetical protein
MRHCESMKVKKREALCSPETSLIALPGQFENGPIQAEQGVCFVACQEFCSCFLVLL